MDFLFCFLSAIITLMSKKSIALLVMLVVAPVLVYLLWSSDEARIRKLVRETARAVEAEDLDDVMSHVSYNYSDEHGLSYLLIKKNLEKKFSLYSGIEVGYENLRIEVGEDGERAGAKLDLRVIATFGEDDWGYVLGDLQNPVSLDLELKKGGPLNRWQVVSASGFMERLRP